MGKKKEAKIRVDLLSEKQQLRYKALEVKAKTEKAEKALRKLESYSSPGRPISEGFKQIDRFSKKSPRIKQGQVRITLPPTKQQAFLQTFFNGERTFGTGQNLPVINNALTSGYGLIKHPLQGHTGRLFGF